MNDADEILSRLPQVTIDQLPDTVRKMPGRAHCNRKPWGSDMSDTVLFANRKFVRLRLTKKGLDAQQHFQFWLNSPQDTEFIQVGCTYPRIPDGHVEEVGYVLDSSMRWVHSRFVERDPLPAERHGIWDHQHCMLCQETIDNDNPHGYTNQDGTWLCTPCFDSYVASRSLGFIHNLHLTE